MNPYLFTDLRSHIPFWALDGPGAGKVMDETEEIPKEAIFLAKALGSQGPPKKALNLIQWSSSYDRAAIAWGVTGMMDYSSALAHKNTCMRIAAAARTKAPGPV